MHLEQRFSIYCVKTARGGFFSAASSSRLARKRDETRLAGPDSVWETSAVSEKGARWFSFPSFFRGLSVRVCCLRAGEQRQGQETKCLSKPTPRDYQIDITVSVCDPLGVCVCVQHGQNETRVAKKLGHTHIS